jgi:hypothetical protein
VDDSQRHSETTRSAQLKWSLSGFGSGQAARYAESICPMVAEGLYLPRGSSNLCRRHCPYWQTCEAEYCGQVRP